MSNQLQMNDFSDICNIAKTKYTSIVLLVVPSDVKITKKFD